MIKILYFTDPHISLSNPVNRKDNFAETVSNKFKETAILAKEHNVDSIICGGDIFHFKGMRTNHAEVTEAMQLFSYFHKPPLVVPGNHDVLGGNINTVRECAIGTLAKAGCITILADFYPIGVPTLFEVVEYIDLKQGNDIVRVKGLPWIWDVDVDTHYYKEVFNGKIDGLVNLLIAHSMIVPGKFFDPYTRIDDISGDEFQFDICMSGHYHDGFPPTHKNGKYFFNPGALTRREYSEENLNRHPSVILLKVENQQVTYETIKLKSALPPEDVFLEPKKLREENTEISDFVKTLSSEGTLEKTGVNKLADDITTSNLSQEVKDKAIQYLREANEG